MRIGVAGLGFGATVQIPVLRGLPDVAVAAVLSARPERGREVADAIGATPCRDLAELLDQDLDAVCLALPPVPGEAALRAAFARKDLAVLTEKPLGVRLEQVRGLARAAAGRVVAVDFELGELDCFRALRAIVAEGRWGPLRAVEIEWHASSRAWAERRWCWKTDRAAGGGVLSLYASQAFHLIETIFAPIETMRAELDDEAARGFAPPGAAPAADRADIEMRLRGGVPLRLALAIASPTSAFRWTARFAHGEATLDNPTPWSFGGCRLTLCDERGVVVATEHESETAEDGRIVPFRRLAERFVAAVRGGDAAMPGFAAGLRVQRLMAAAEESASIRRSIPCVDDAAATAVG